MRSCLLLLAFLIATPAESKSAPLGAGNSVATLTQELKDAKNRVEVAERDERNTRQRNTILEVKSQLEDKAYSRLEILSAIFALFLTVLVVGFGIRTEKAAARAAKGELADRQRELDIIMAAARAAGSAAEEAAASARASADSALGHATTAAGHSARAAQGVEAIMLAVTSVEHEKAEKSKSETARHAAATPKAERTIEEFRALIVEAKESNRWADVIELCQGMRFLHGEDNFAQSFALLNEGFALSRLDRTQEELNRYNELVDRFIDDKDVQVRRNVVFGLFNKSLTYLIIRKNDVAAADLTKLWKKFSRETNEEIRERLDITLLWKAAAFAAQGNVQEAIKALRGWKVRVGRFDCDAVKDIALFNGISRDPAFIRYLDREGCGDSAISSKLSLDPS